MALRSELARAFTLAGWRAHRAGTLEEARMVLGAIDPPDVILTDRRLSDGDGAQLVGIAPVVVYSGDWTPVPGAVATLLKPIPLTQIVRRVADALTREAGEAVAG